MKTRLEQIPTTEQEANVKKEGTEGEGEMTAPAAAGGIGDSEDERR